MFGELELLTSVTLTEGGHALHHAALVRSPWVRAMCTAGMWSGSDSAFGHLEPSQEARCLLVAPATANIMAKLANGLADDLLSTQALAFTGPQAHRSRHEPQALGSPCDAAKS